MALSLEYHSKLSAGQYRLADHLSKRLGMQTADRLARCLIDPNEPFEEFIKGEREYIKSRASTLGVELPENFHKPESALVKR